MNKKVVKRTVKAKKPKDNSMTIILLAFLGACIFIYIKTTGDSKTSTGKVVKDKPKVLVNKSKRMDTSTVLDEAQCIIKTVSCKTLKLDNNKGEGVLIKDKILYIVKKDTNLSLTGGDSFNKLELKDSIRAKSYITLSNSYIVGHLKFDRKNFDTVRVYLFSGPIYDKKFSIGYELGAQQAREINLDAIPSLLVEVKSNGNIKLADEYFKNRITKIKDI